MRALYRSILLHGLSRLLTGYSAACFHVVAWVFGLALSFSSVSSSRSRSLLRNNWSRPARYCGGQAMAWAPYQAAAFIVNEGSTRCGRASATRSARPAAMMVLTWSAVVMAPTHIVAIPASFLIWSENGVWNIRP